MQQSQRGVERRAPTPSQHEARAAYATLGKASLTLRAARERLDNIAGGLEPPSRVLAVEGISHELTDCSLALMDAAGKIRRLYAELAAT